MRTNGNELTRRDQLAPGALLRQSSGELYKVEGLHASLDSAEQQVVLRPYDNASESGTFLCSESLIGEPFSIDNRISLLPAPSKKHLLKFWRAYFRDLKPLDLIVERYAEPWRHAYDQRSLFRLFERADQAGLKLTPEDVLGVLLYRAACVPGLSDTTHREMAVPLAKCLSPMFSAVKLNWAEIWKAWENTSPSRIRDILCLNVACDALEFCVNEELQWLDAKPVVGKDSRREFETDRLKTLLALAANGPIFTPSLSELEKLARINIEGLRQAWLKKYSPAAA